MTLEQLAEKHCYNDSYYPRTYEFTLDQLRALIKEVVGEPVAGIRWIKGLEGARSEYFETGWADGERLPVGTKLYALSVSLGREADSLED